MFAVRPVGGDSEYLFHGAGKSARCTFFTQAKGCELPTEGRPAGCLALVPSQGSCRAPYKLVYRNAKQQVFADWVPYQDEIIMAAAAVGKSYEEDSDEDYAPSLYQSLMGGSW